MKRLAVLAFAVAPVQGAEVYYSDGSYASIPDSWVEVVPKDRMDCDQTPDDPRCAEGASWLSFHVEGWSKELRQQDVLRAHWVHSGSE